MPKIEMSLLEQQYDREKQENRYKIKMAGLVIVGILGAITTIGMFWGKDNLLSVLMMLFFVLLIVLLTYNNS